MSGMMLSLLATVCVALGLVAVHWLGRWMEWRELCPLLDHHAAWMQAQEELNRSLVTDLHQLALSIRAMQERSDAERERR